MTRPCPARLGGGVLADRIGAPLARAGPVYGLDSAESTPDGCRVVVLSSDAWDIVGESGIRAACASRGLPWQPVRAELGRVLIGPVEPVGTPGCVQCGQSRRRLARRYPDGADAVHERYGPVLRSRGSALLTNLAADLVAALVAAEVEALAAGRQPVRTRGALLALDLT